MNTRFFAEFITVLSRKVNPCPNVSSSMKRRYNDEDNDDIDSCCKYTATVSLMNPPNANGGCNLPRAVSEISLHNKVLDITFDAEEEDKDNKEEKKEKEEEPKKEEEEEVGFWWINEVVRRASII